MGKNDAQISVSNGFHFLRPNYIPLFRDLLISLVLKSISQFRGKRFIKMNRVSREITLQSERIHPDCHDARLQLISPSFGLCVAMERYAELGITFLMSTTGLCRVTTAECSVALSGRGFLV